jgi:hypothetical protein
MSLIYREEGFIVRRRRERDGKGGDEGEYLRAKGCWDAKGAAVSEGGCFGSKINLLKTRGFVPNLFLFRKGAFLGKASDSPVFFLG